MSAIKEISNSGIAALEAARFLHAFVECNRQTQENVLEMVAIVMDSDSTDDERTVASDAITEALFPMLAADVPENYRKLIKDPDSSVFTQELQAEKNSLRTKCGSLWPTRE